MKGLVVVGASYAGVQAALTARDAGFAKPIAIVGDEPCLPYQRPPLSKDYLLDNASEQSLFLRDNAFFGAKGIELILGSRVIDIDLRDRRAILERGSVLGFEQLVIAAGSRARRLEVPGGHLEGVCYLRSLSDAAHLKMRLKQAEDVVIIGGGFIGLEVAASATKLGKKVVLIEAGHRLLERATSPVVSSFLLDAHLRAGVEIRLLETVAAFEGARGKLSTVLLSSGSKVRADMVVVGIGGIANDELARKAGLNCTNGVTVSAHGMTDVDGVFACGDCAYHFNRFSKTWTRLESVQNAQDQAKAAGLAIAGKHSPDISVPRFWSDQFDLKLQTTGIAGSFDAAVVRGTVDTGRFSTFYFKDGCLLAVDSINRPGDQLVARRLIAAGVSPSQGEAADISFDLKSLVTP